MFWSAPAHPLSGIQAPIQVKNLELKHIKACLPVKMSHRVVVCPVDSKLLDAWKVPYQFIREIMKEFHYPLSAREANYFITGFLISCISELSTELQRLQ